MLRLEDVGMCRTVGASGPRVLTGRHSVCRLLDINQYMFLNMSINSQIFSVSLKFSFKRNTTAAVNETRHIQTTFSLVNASSPT